MDLSHSPKPKSHPELIERAKALVPGILRQLNVTPVRADKIYAALVAELKDEGAADQAIRQLIGDRMLEAEVPVADESSNFFDRMADMSLRFHGFHPIPLDRIYVKATDLLWPSGFNRKESSPSAVGANTPKNGDGIPASVSKPPKSSAGQDDEADPTGDNPSVDSTMAKAKAKQRGRKKADYETEKRESQVADDWKKAKGSGAYKLDFANEKGMTLKDLDKLLNRVSKRNSRLDK